jgi:hypothetical protein
MLEELQSLSEVKKKQVLIVATIIIMVIVVGVWMSYFNSIVAGTAQEAATQATSSVAVATTSVVAPTQASGPGLWQDIKNGFGSIANIFSGPSQYKVQPQSN